MIKATKLLYVFFLVLILNIAAIGQVSPVLLVNGDTPQRALHIQNFKMASGYSIFKFFVRKEGQVDSSKIFISSKYYLGAESDSLRLVANKKDHELIKSFKFLPLEADMWVQCKVYTFFYNDKPEDPLQLGGRMDKFGKFDFGLEELYYNELNSYFKDESGKPLYLRRGDTIFFAPSYIKGSI